MAARTHPHTLGSDHTSPTAKAAIWAMHDDCLGRVIVARPRISTQIWEHKLYVMVYYNIEPTFQAEYPGARRVPVPALQLAEWHTTLLLARWRNTN